MFISRLKTICRLANKTKCLFSNYQNENGQDIENQEIKIAQHKAYLSN